MIQNVALLASYLLSLLASSSFSSLVFFFEFRLYWVRNPFTGIPAVQKKKRKKKEKKGGLSSFATEIIALLTKSHHHRYACTILLGGNGWYCPLVVA